MPPNESQIFVRLKSELEDILLEADAPQIRSNWGEPQFDPRRGWVVELELLAPGYGLSIEQAVNLYLAELAEPKVSRQSLAYTIQRFSEHCTRTLIAEMRKNRQVFEQSAMSGVP